LAHARVGKIALVLALAAALSGCGATLPTPPPGTHPRTSHYVEVPYPPPPARVEMLPPQPRDDAVWVDGEWLWHGRRWNWEPGGGVVPPPGATFAPWVATRVSTGALLWLPGAWYDAQGHDLPHPPVLAPAGGAAAPGAPAAP
jgi:hypothetical protein